MIRIDTFSKICILVLCLFGAKLSYGQLIHSGKIIFTRRTNLEKRYAGTKQFGQNKKWMKDPKIDKFVLYFNDSSSLFAPIPPQIGDEDRSWATMNNTTYQNLKEDTLVKAFSFFGSNLYLTDSLRKRQWIITGGERNIAGYKTKQAMWQANDSTRIYAWFSEQIVPSVGPEDFNGLPGVILGLAIEDGGVVYFAEKVKPLTKEDQNFKTLMPKGKEKEYYTHQKLQNFVEDRFVKQGYTGRLLYDFYIW